MVECKGELKGLLMRVKEKTEKAALKFTIQKIKLMASCPITSCYDKPRQHIKKQRHHFADKVLYSQSYGFFLVVMYGYESWIIKKAEHWRNDAFKLWCWRRLLRISWTAKRSNQSILKKINSEYSLRGLILSWSSNTLLPDTKNWLIGRNPDAGKDWRQKEKRVAEDEMGLDRTTDLTDTN